MEKIKWWCRVEKAIPCCNLGDIYQKDIFTHTALKLSEMHQDAIFSAGDLQQFFLASEDNRKHVSDHTIKLLTGEMVKEEKKEVLAPLSFLTTEFKMYEDLGGQTKYFQKTQ